MSGTPAGAPCFQRLPTHFSVNPDGGQAEVPLLLNA